MNFLKNAAMPINCNLLNQKRVVLDLSANNTELKNIDISNPLEFEKYILEKINQENAKYAIGKYNENRVIYKHSGLFGAQRSIHLGIDIWVKQGEPVYATFDAVVHSFQDNKGKGDYGPTIILEHNTTRKFYTLYGHLSLDSLNNLKEGQVIKQGDKIGEVGHYPYNGNWPSHLHFEIILDMLGKKGDFAGVATQQDKEKYLALCPDPNIILKVI